MFVCVKYGLDAQKENYVNANCSCAVLMDHLKGKVVSEITRGLAKRRDEEKKVIARLSRQRHVCHRQLQKLKHGSKGGDAGDSGSRSGDAEGSASGDEGSAAGDAPEGGGGEDDQAKVAKVEGWISGCEAEISEREDLIERITSYEETVSNVVRVDLAESTDNTALEMHKFHPDVKATAVLPLRCAVNLIGYPPGPDNVDPLSMDSSERPPPIPLLNDFQKVSRTPEVEDMINTIGGGPGGGRGK